MKKTLFLLGIVSLFIIMLLIPNQVEAATTVGTEADLLTALTNGETEITLSAGFELTSTVAINNSVTIDGGFSDGNLVRPDGYNTNATANVTSVDAPGDNGSWWDNILILILIAALVVLVIL